MSVKRITKTVDLGNGLNLSIGADTDDGSVRYVEVYLGADKIASSWTTLKDIQSLEDMAHEFASIIPEIDEEE